MKAIKLSWSVIITSTLFLLIGCDIEQEKSDYLCTTVENKFIDGTTGTRPVFAVDGSIETRIGYSHYGQLVLHSECAPALSKTTAKDTRFEWYLFGNETENDGITSIRFYPTNNVINIHATRFETQGKATEEFAERHPENDSKAKRTKAIFYGDFPFSRVEVSDQFNQENQKQVIAAIVDTEKTQRWNPNTLQFDCLYTSTINNEFDAGCTNELKLDDVFFGQPTPLLDYFQTLVQPFDYSTEESDYWRQVNRYQ
ncbi:hypothetical protein ACPV5V_19500 [Vibrio campbellii]